MTTHVKDGGVWKGAQEIHIKDGGVWKRVKELHIKDSGVWKAAFIDVLTAATVDKTYVSGSAPSGIANTDAVTCTPVGGSGHSYLWERVSGDTQIFINDANSATVAFYTVSSGSYSAVFRCGVTAGGVTVYSPNVVADLVLG